ncbi:MAG: pantoate kinase [Thermoplasmatota archaeon]
MKAIAFAPGHISGFFEPIYYNMDYARSGSRGAGINLSLGAISQVVVEKSDHQYIDIIVNDKNSNALVTKRAIQHLIGNIPMTISISTNLDLPLRQGFGMSAAGTLSSCLALAKILQIPKEDAIKASHIAEVESRTGLGDVIASSFGGIELRREAGLPPWGSIEHIPGFFNIVLCVIGKEIDTSKILADTDKIESIGSYGKYCIKKLIERPSIENLFYLSNLFTNKTGLADEKVLEAIENANNYGMASMCMLGNSVFSVGDTDLLCNILSKFGTVYICPIDRFGAQVINE